eukprot:4815836-Amphidinium_carterae.2
MALWPSYLCRNGQSEVKRSGAACVLPSLMVLLSRRGASWISWRTCWPRLPSGTWLHECTSRRQELQQVKHGKTFMSIDAGGRSVPELFADVSTEYLCRMAFTRRSKALDQFDLVSFYVMEEWSDFLFDLLHRDVPLQLQVTLPHFLEPDRQLFVLVAGLIKHGSIAKYGDAQPRGGSPAGSL